MSKKLNELRQRKAKLVDRNSDLTKMMTDFPDEPDKRPGKLTDDQVNSEFETNESQINELGQQIKAEEERERKWTERRNRTSQLQTEMERSQGTPVPVTTLSGPEDEEDEDQEDEDPEDDQPEKGAKRLGGGSRRGRPQAVTPEKGIRLAKVLRARGAIHIGQYNVAKQIVSDIPELRAAMEAGTFTSGGFMIPENYVAEFIELLRPISVVMSMGVTEAPLVNGSLTLPKITGGATATYIGESVNIPPSQLTGGQVKAVAHKLAVLVPVSNDLLRYAVASADVVVRNDMVRAAAQTRDAAQIRDDGGGNAPKGLRYWAPAANIETMTAAPDLTKIDADLGKLITNLLSANVFSIPRGAGLQAANGVVNMSSVGWILSPRTWNYLSSLRDGNGNKAFPEMADGLLKGFPYAVSSQIPENLGGGSNETEVYFAAFSDVIIAQDPRVEMDVSNVAAYHDGSNVQAAFSLDQTVMRLIMNDDLVVRHTEAVTVLTGVTWGG